MLHDRIRVFKRLETDAEFRARVQRYIPHYLMGATLDDYVWHEAGLQRRIIEDER